MNNICKLKKRQQKVNKEKPSAVAAANEGSSNNLYNIYTQDHLRAQAFLRRRYAMGNAQAILTADMLVGSV